MTIRKLTLALLAMIGVACGGGGEPELPVPSTIDLNATTDGQQAFAGGRLARPLSVTVRSADGATVPRAEVRWSVVGATPATVSDQATVTDGAGVAEVDVILGSTAGTVSVRAALAVNSGKFVTFTLTVLDPPVLTGVQPTSFAARDTVVLQGSRLTDTLGVEIGGVLAKIVDAAPSGQQLSVEVPPCLVPGAVTVRVVLPGFASATVSGTYSVSGDVLTLAAGEYLSIDPAALDGCATFPQAGGLGAEYLLVPQATTAVAGLTADYELVGDSVVTVVIAPAPREAPPSIAEQFHLFLRRREEQIAREPKPMEPVTAAPYAAPVAMKLGDRRQFKVCNKVTCSATADFTSVTAVAKYVGDHAAIFLDLEAPDTLTPAGFLQFGELFENELYEVATRAFGSESDVDADGHVLVLMTPVVNKLTPRSDCETSIITGFFFAIDIDPAYRNDSRSNQAEVFYALTPDPAGTVSCAHPVARIQRFVPVTFVHELQHMINYTQHVLVRRGSSEILWLNEAMSHLSEELAALHFADQGDESRFSEFALGDVYDAYKYLESPGATSVLFVEGTGTLAERGAAWLYLRWLLDQFGPAMTRRLSETSLVGAANVSDAAGEPHGRLVSQWTLANWVSDLPAFTAPPELRYVTWRFRTTFASLHDQSPDRFPSPYPLVPAAFSGGTFGAAGSLRSGSGDFYLVTQQSGQRGFTVRLRAPGGGPVSPTVVPRLNVIRIR